MIRTLQNRYVIVTGDLKSSRRLEARAEVQEELKNALRIVNRRFGEEIPAKFMERCRKGGGGFIEPEMVQIRN